MGKPVFEYLEGDNIYICKTCKIHLSGYNQLLSKAFRGRGGKAFLFNEVYVYKILIYIYDYIYIYMNIFIHIHENALYLFINTKEII